MTSAGVRVSGPGPAPGARPLTTCRCEKKSNPHTHGHPHSTKRALNRNPAAAARLLRDYCMNVNDMQA